MGERFRQATGSKQVLMQLQAMMDQHIPAQVAAISHNMQAISDQITQLAAKLDLATSSPKFLEEQLRHESARLSEELTQLRQIALENSHSLTWLAEQNARTPLPAPAATPLVSIIMPTWNRGYVIERALQSVRDQNYQQWECIIVDDGSTDDTRERLKPYLSDKRFRYLTGPHRGVSAARNAGLEQARGEIIAYLDTDNLWLPNYLTAIVTAFVEADELQSAYTAQLVHNHKTELSYVRAKEFDFAAISQDNYVDLNVFAHRRRLFERYDGFDEQLERLNDWDLILRYTEHDKTRLVPMLGGVYHLFATPDQISSTYSSHYNRYRIFSKRPRPPQAPLKVLYALWHYPQLSESYVRTEILAVRQLGVEVEAWSEEDVAAPFLSEVPVHHGSLRDAVALVKPDIVHTHWLHMSEKYGAELQAAGVPLTVRGHGFEFSPELVARLDKNPTIKAAYIFPHFASECASLSEKIKALPVTFNPALYPPSHDKDRRMVMRTGCALPTKDYATFMRIALLCPDHRFVLVLCQAYMKEEYLDEVIALRDQLGAPVEILSNVQHEDVARLMGRAGIYLHTNGPNSSFGMPISISEAMATGSYIIARRCPGAVAYIQDAGQFYETAEEAADLIRQTEKWSDEQWHRAYLRSIDRAYSNFVSTEALTQIVADWHEILKKNGCPASPEEEVENQSVSVIGSK